MKRNKKLDKALILARCPKCRYKVVRSPLTAGDPLSNNDENDPEVWCSDMGHWAGKLSECLNYNDKKGQKR